MLFYEFRKLLMKPVFLLLVLFMAAVLLVRFYMSCGDLDYVDIALYQKVRAEVSELPYDEALTKLQRDRDGLILVTFSSMFGSSEEEQEFFSEQFAGIAEPYGMTVREMISEYECAVFCKHEIPNIAEKMEKVASPFWRRLQAARQSFFSPVVTVAQTYHWVNNYRFIRSWRSAMFL